ncbi:MAG: hypothetical protein QXV17_12940 [Candidatus Micrarchaeaceae archaeon]
MLWETKEKIPLHYIDLRSELRESDTLDVITKVLDHIENMEEYDVEKEASKVFFVNVSDQLRLEITIQPIPFPVSLHVLNAKFSDNTFRPVTVILMLPEETYKESWFDASKYILLAVKRHLSIEIEDSTRKTF